MTKLEPRPLERISPALPEMTTLQSALIAAKIKIYDPMEVEAYKTETTRRLKWKRIRNNVISASVSSGLAFMLGLVMLHVEWWLILFPGLCVALACALVNWAVAFAARPESAWRTVSYAVYHSLQFGVIPLAVETDLLRIRRHTNFSVTAEVEIDTLERDPVMWIRDPDDPGARYCTAIWD